MRPNLCLLALLVLTVAGRAEGPKPNALSPQEIADGWLLFFDGETTFGWKIDGEAKVQDGWLVLGGAKETKATLPPVPGPAHLHFESEGTANLVFVSAAQGEAAGTLSSKTQAKYRLEPGQANNLDVERSATSAGGATLETGTIKYDPGHPPAVRFDVAAGATVRLRNVKAHPLGLKPIFNGKDLTGWKKYTGDEKRAKSDFSVTKEGWLHMKSGPGDLQTIGRYDDFILQFECRTNGKGLNSGVFFRCIQDQYQNGYEAQIHNVFTGGDRTKPSDFGTGAIYRRVRARKVVADDNEWFTLTLVAQGNRIRTWVNGYATVDWTDDRPPHDNPRNGSKTGPGHISLQGHDPTTDAHFRNIRLVELKK